jgi:hypothetical protein
MKAFIDDVRPVQHRYAASWTRSEASCVCSVRGGRDDGKAGLVHPGAVARPGTKNGRREVFGEEGRQAVWRPARTTLCSWNASTVASSTCSPPTGG